MQQRDIVIIGAGAAGLMCARSLVHEGFSVTILEARPRIGGRILTFHDNSFPIPVELGAEFIHGDLPVTKKLFNEAGINFHPIKGDMWRSENGKFVEQDDFIENADEVIKKLKELSSDMSVADFLDQYFPGEKFVRLRETLKSYVEGYDAADSKQASSFALLQELIGSDESQYRVEGGYMQLIDFLANDCKNGICDFHLETVASKIHWTKGSVEVFDGRGTSFMGKKAVITAPLGVLQAPAQTIGQVQFAPAINGVDKAIKSLGNGHVIKIILNFDEPIWDQAENTAGINKNSYPGFIFSDAAIPTWWTQYPEKNGMITGWIGGTKATALQNEPDDKILHLALESLATIFKLSRNIIESKLKCYRIHNWGLDEFSKGAYSYETVHSKNAKNIISASVEDTLYFAGEAYYTGSERGTVEAALVSGQETAKTISRLAD